MRRHFPLEVGQFLMFCSNCGKKGQTGNFCENCGTSLNSKEKSLAADTKPAGISSGGTTSSSSGVGAGKSTENQVANWALGFGIASAVFFEFLIPNLVAIVLGSIGLNKASELARQGAAKTGKGKSMAGLVLGIIYVLVLIIGRRIGMFG